MDEYSQGYVDSRSYFDANFIVVLLFVIASIFFCWTLYSTLKKIPRENQKFPSWFVWFFLIPWVGYIFQWIMLPFGIPMALKNTLPNDQNAISSADVLMKLGIAQIVLTLMGFAPVHPIDQIAVSIAVVLWFVYWGLFLRFRNKYLRHLPPQPAQKIQQPL